MDPELNLLLLLVLPSLSELFFRGFVARSLAMRYKPFPAMVLATLLFAAVFPPVFWIPAFLLGFAAVDTDRRAGHLAFAIVCHTSFMILFLKGLSWI